MSFSPPARTIAAVCFGIAAVGLVARELYGFFAPLAGEEACIAAVNDARSGRVGAGDGKNDRAGSVVRACAPLFGDAACRDAHERFDKGAPVDRMWRLAETCRNAYCPRLKAPKPTLCDDGERAPLELAAAWSEFVPAVLKAEHGSRAERVIGVLRAPTATVTSPPPNGR